MINRIKYSKIKIMLCAAVLLHIFALYACGITGNDGTKEEPVKNVEEPEDETLEFYIWSDEETYVRKVVEAYNALKGKEEVRLHVIPNGEHEEWLKNYDESYDVDILGIRGNASLLELQKRGILLGLRIYIKDSNLDVAAYGNMFNEIVYDGDYYGLPTRSTCWALFYNKEIFDRLKVSYPEAMTWKEYLELAEKLTVKGEEGEVDIWGGYFTLWAYHLYIPQKGYHLLDDDLSPVQETMELLKCVHSGTHVPYETVKERPDDSRYEFEKGNIAMMINGEWMVNMFLEDEETGRDVPEWDIAPMPAPEGAESGTTVGMYQFAGITSTCKCPRKAFSFLLFLCGEPGAGIYARNAIIPAYSNEEIEQSYIEAAGTERAAVFFDSQRLQEQPMWYGYDRLVELFRENAGRMLEGRCTVEEAAADFEKQRKEALKKG